MVDRPRESDELGRVIGRLKAQERLMRPPSRPSPLLPIIFSYPGTVVAGITSPPFPPMRFLVRLTTIGLSTLVAVTGDLTVDVKVNGDTVKTITLSSGTTITETMSALVGPSDILTVTTVAVSAGTSNMSVGMDWRVP